MPAKKIAILVFLFFFMQHHAFAAGDFPYVNILIKTPAQEDPFPGMGNNYASLGRGIDTILWNPAGLGKISTSELFIGLPSAVVSPSFAKDYSLKDAGLDINELISGESPGTNFSAGVIFTDDPADTELTTREFTGHLAYSTVTTGSNYKQAVKVNDRYCFGVSTHGETGYSVGMAGNFPAQLKIALDLLNLPETGGLAINNNGNMTVTYTPEGSGTGYSYTTTGPVWKDFLVQDQRLPVSLIFNLRNALDVQSNITLTSAANFGKLSVGVNFTPINATYTIDNSARLIFKEGASDPYFFTPSFEAKDEAGLLKWTTTPDLYGSPDGYNKSYLFKIPAGENIGEFKYQGVLSAATARIDLGAMYDYNDDLTVGVAFENVTRAALDFKARGRVTYINYRTLPEGEEPSDITSDNFAFFKEGELGIEPEKYVQIPQRIRFGATLRKPYLITLDYEIQPTPISYRNRNDDGTYTTMIFDNVRLIRAGFETQVFKYPVWLRAGTILLLRPDFLGADPLTQQTFDSMFAYGFYPFKLDIGLRSYIQNTEYGMGAGFNGMYFLTPWTVWFLATPPIIDWRNRDQVSAVGILLPALMTTNNLGDALNQDFNRILYFSLYAKQENWQVVLQNAFDLGASGRAYNTIGSRRDIAMWVKWATTLTIGIRF